MNKDIETLKQHEKLHANSVTCYRNMLASGRIANVAREQLAYHEPFLKALRFAIAGMESNTFQEALVWSLARRENLGPDEAIRKPLAGPAKPKLQY